MFYFMNYTFEDLVNDDSIMADCCEDQWGNMFQYVVTEPIYEYSNDAGTVKTTVCATYMWIEPVEGLYGEVGWTLVRWWLTKKPYHVT